MIGLPPGINPSEADTRPLIGHTRPLIGHSCPLIGHSCLGAEVIVTPPGTGTRFSQLRDLFRVSHHEAVSCMQSVQHTHNA